RPDFHLPTAESGHRGQQVQQPLLRGDGHVRGRPDRRAGDGDDRRVPFARRPLQRQTPRGRQGAGAVLALPHRRVLGRLVRGVRGQVGAMFTIGSRLYFGIAAAAFVAGAVYWISTDLELFGTIVLLSLAVVATFLGAVVIAFRDADIGVPAVEA